MDSPVGTARNQKWVEAEATPWVLKLWTRPAASVSLSLSFEAQDACVPQLDTLTTKLCVLDSCNLFFILFYFEKTVCPFTSPSGFVNRKGNREDRFPRPTFTRAKDVASSTPSHVHNWINLGNRVLEPLPPDALGLKFADSIRQGNPPHDVLVLFFLSQSSLLPISYCFPFSFLYFCYLLLSGWLLGKWRRKEKAWNESLNLEFFTTLFWVLKIGKSEPAKWVLLCSFALVVVLILQFYAHNFFPSLTHLSLRRD